MSSRRESVAVGVPTYGRDGSLCETLRQIVAQTIHVDEIIVVDQTPLERHDAPTRRFLTQCQADTRFRLVHQSRPSLPAALNRIVAEACSDVVIFCDDDIDMPSDMVASHLEVLAEFPAVSAVGAQVVPRSGSVVEVIPARSSWGFHHPACPKNYRHPFDGPVIAGANFSVIRADWIAVGGADERIRFMSDEEVANRFVCEGRVVRFDPRCSVRHLEGDRGGQAERRQRGLRREFDNAYSVIYFGFRYRRGLKKIGTTLQGARGAFDRKTVLSGWRIPWAAIQLTGAVMLAAYNASRPRRSPFARHVVKEQVAG